MEGCAGLWSAGEAEDAKIAETHLTISHEAIFVKKQEAKTSKKNNVDGARAGNLDLVS
jgi:hypothetical protein